MKKSTEMKKLDLLLVPFEQIYWLIVVNLADLPIG